MKTFLMKRLVVPLGAGAVLSILVSLCVADPWRSLLVNLAASFLGSIVTVLFVERILRSGEEQRWEKVRGHVGKQVTMLGNAVAGSVRTALIIPPPEALFDAEIVNDPARVRQVIIDLIERDLLPDVAGLELTDQTGWRNFATNLRGVMLSCDRLISLFGPNLDPKITELILDLQEKAGLALAPYEILPDMLGVPFEELKPNLRGQSSVPIVRAMVRGVIREAGQMLKICAALLREIGQRFPEPRASASSRT